MKDYKIIIVDSWQTNEHMLAEQIARNTIIVDDFIKYINQRKTDTGNDYSFVANPYKGFDLRKLQLKQSKGQYLTKDEKGYVTAMAENKRRKKKRK